MSIELANLVILCTTNPDDPGATWTPLLREQVPPQIRSPEVLGRLVSGEIAKVHEDSPLWYRAIKLEETQ